jgi:WD40 repeat protein
MRFIHVTLALLLIMAGKAAAKADEPAGSTDSRQVKTASKEEIDRLVKRLGDDQFTRRLQAKKDLECIGAPALGALKKAAESAGDPEVRNAARALIENFEQKNSGMLRVFTGHGSRVNGVAISADGKRALSASWDGVLRDWNVEKGELIHEMHGHGNALMSVAISPDGKRALSGSSDMTMRLWDLESGKELRAFQGHPQTVWDVAFSPDGKKALSGCSDGIARLWDLDSGKELLTLETIKGGRAWSVAFTPDGKQALTGGGNVFENGTQVEAALRLWDLVTGQEVRRYDGHTKDVRSVAIAPGGKRFLSGSFDGTMRLWDLQTGKELKRFAGPGHFVEAVGFTRDGKRAVCSYGPRIVEAVYDADPRCSLRLWDLASGKELQQFRGHSAPVLSLALSADGRFLVSGSADNTMRLWQMAK